MTARGDVWRGAPAQLLPTVRPLLDDPDADVRWTVVHALRQSERAAARYADDLHRIATGYPTTDPARVTPESLALETLLWLGDARWVDIVLAAPGVPRTWSLRDPQTEAVVAAAGRGLAHLAATQPDHPAVPLLADTVASAAPAVRADATRELLTALPHLTPHRAAVVRALLRLGCTDPALAAHLRVVTATPGRDHRARIEAAHALWRFTGEAAPLIDLLGTLLTEARNPWIGREHHAAVAGAAGGLAPLLPRRRPT